MPSAPNTILFVSDDPTGYGGTELGLLQTASSLDPTRWRPIAMVPARGALYEMLTGAGIDTRILNFYRLPRLWRVRRYFPVDSWLTIAVNGLRFKRLLKRERVCLVQTSAKETFNVRNLSRVTRRAGIPIVWSCHDSNPRVLTYCGPRLCNDLDRILAVSCYMKDELLRAGLDCENKITVLHNALDLGGWNRRILALKYSLRDELGIPHEVPLIGLVGRLDPVKDHLTFLRAAQIVAARHNEALFVIVGIVRPDSRLAPFASYYRDLLRLAQSAGLRGRVLTTGWKTDTVSVMTAVDILIQPSLRETFGRTLIEAMAAGKPVIATKVGGMPEVVVDNQTGLLIPPADYRALADAILNLLHNPERRRVMGTAGRARVEEHFDVKLRILRLERIYNEILGNPGGTPTAAPQAAGSPWE